MKRDGCARVPDVGWLTATDEAGIWPLTPAFHQMLRTSAGYRQRRDHRRLAREPPIREARSYKASDLIVGHTPDSIPVGPSCASLVRLTLWSAGEGRALRAHGPLHCGVGHPPFWAGVHPVNWPSCCRMLS